MSGADHTGRFWVGVLSPPEPDTGGSDIDHFREARPEDITESMVEAVYGHLLGRPDRLVTPGDVRAALGSMLTGAER
jgi:hypothetical protein